MIASFAGVIRGGERNALDAPVAALAGLSVAFLAFAAPAEILADLIGSTGLASLIPAAEPPLGVKARFGLGAAGAVGVFAIVFLLLRWLDRLGSGRAREAVPADEMEFPRLRRRDLHPDAPPRAPLLAGLELGEPAEEEPESVERLRLPEELSIEPKLIAEVDSSDGGEAIPDLMKRLEQGLARRRSAVEPTQITDPPVFESDPAPDRLQSAIESLQRLASRQD